MLRRTISLLTAVLLLTGCGLFVPVSSPTPNRYTLSATAPPIQKSLTPTATILLIPAPTGAPGYETTQMVYSEKPYRISYFANHQWIDIPPRLFWALAAHTLEQSGRFEAVVTAPYVGPVDATLNLTMFSITQDFQKHPSVVHAQVRAEWVSKPSNAIVAARTFSVSVPATQDTPEGGVQAANKAVAQLLGAVRTFVITESEKTPIKANHDEMD